MDTTPEFVQMCRQAKEIQELWKKKAGDWLVTPEGIKVLSSKVIQIKGVENTLRYAIPKRVTLTSPVLESDPVGALEISIDYVDFEMYPQEYCAWLPHQDQLQTIYDCTPIKYLYDFIWEVYQIDEHTNDIGYDWECPNIEKDFKEYYRQFGSIEQIILAFVMEKKYSKKWNGSDWVTE